MKSSMIRLLFVFIFAISAKTDKTDSVQLIKDKTEFDSVIAGKNVLIKFFAPWCGHCKALAPEYIKAAKALSDDKFDLVSLAEVDCTSDKTKDVCQEFKVSGYPTIKYFTKGSRDPENYEGARKSDDLVKFVKSMTSDPITLLETQEHLDKLIESDNIVVVQYSQNKNTKRFIQTAEKNRLRYTFAKISDAEIHKKHSQKDDSIVLYRSFDEPKMEFKGETVKLIEWIDGLSFPYIGELHGDNYRKYYEKKVPLLWFAVNMKDTATVDALKKMGQSLFKKYRENFYAVYIDGKKFKEPLSKMGFGGNLPSVMLIDQRNGEKKYKMTEKITAENVEAFAKKYIKNEIEQFFKSAKVPSRNKGPLFEVVGDTFNEFVLDEEHDVVLEYYLTYCKHCKKFAPEYKKLSKMFSEEKLIKIAKINGEENDTPVAVSGYPTVMIFPSGKKDKPIKYEGEMTAEKVEQWINQNSPLLKAKSKSTETKKEL